MEAYMNDSHRDLQKRVRRFVQEDLLPHIEEWEAEQKAPFHLLSKAGKAGFLGCHFPKEYGGGGELGVVGNCVVSEELGKAGAGMLGTFVGSGVIAVGPLAHFGTDEQKRNFLAPALRGDKLAAIAMTEPEAGSDVGGVTTTAKTDGDQFVIDGGKIFITNGTQCDFVIVAARSGTVEDKHRGLSLILVEKGTPGLRVKRKLNKLGWRASETAELEFVNCRVPVKNLVGELNKGFYHLMHNLDVERIVVAADGVGAAQAAYEAAAEYALKRKQFGQPIAQFQDIRFTLVDMHVAVQTARLIVYNAAWLIDQGKQAPIEASSAKYYASEVTRRVARDAVQICGGQGFLMDNIVQRFYRDAPVYTIGAGTSQIQKQIIAKQLGL